ncbi:hypothetical protein BLNAU_16997 [Blattamonas nauphoetae]|uniref:Protein kinase domain-containing protein n=1 Tax=Blattamonas nauphoetae TaxID=2049346 RepID=A0ABQ9X9Q5_9EUKA|nr:hypothetical protein BLNAU_16997 [Blattamonas nauphoetae]
MAILTHLSPIWIFLDSQDNLLFQQHEMLPQPKTEPTNEPTADSFCEPSLPSLNDSTVDSADHFCQHQDSSHPSAQIEGQRWMAPEVAEKKANIDPLKAPVFSLGLILWELETGLVPFGELDDVNAQRQLGCGTLPAMEKWTNESKIDLVTRCLSLDPKERPSLDEIVSLIDSDEKFQQPAMTLPRNTNEF